MGRHIGINLGLALTYIALAWLVSLFFALPAPIWPSTGLAAFAALAGGWRWMPGIALGSFIANDMIMGWSSEAAAWIVLGNVLGPMLGSTLLRRQLPDPQHPFEMVKGVAGFFLWLGGLNGLIAAFFGASALVFIEGYGDEIFRPTLIQWSVGDAASVILLTPALFLWYKNPRISRPVCGWNEPILASTILLGMAAFSSFLPSDAPQIFYGSTALILLPLTWVALRFSQRDAYTLLAFVFIIMLSATLLGRGPFSLAGVELPMTNLQMRTTLFGAFILLASALDHERRRAIRALAELNTTLEQRILRRTHQLEESQDRLLKILETLPAPMAMSRLDTGTVIEANASAASTLGYHPDELTGVNIGNFYVDLTDRALILSELERLGIVRGKEMRFRHRDGHILWLLVSAAVMQDGEHPTLLISFQDITEAKERENELAHLATTDALTGAANRRHFLTLAEEALCDSVKHHQPLALLILDLDLFKPVNDRYGHLSGDKALRLVASTLRATLRHEDVAGRLGGEEFGVLLPNTDARGARELAERLRVAIERLVIPLEDDVQLRITSSIGGTLNTPDESGCITLVKMLSHADQALYDAKNKGRNRVEFWPIA